jgi:hypothetical protein
MNMHLWRFIGNHAAYWVFALKGMVTTSLHMEENDFLCLYITTRHRRVSKEGVLDFKLCIYIETEL